MFYFSFEPLPLGKISMYSGKNVVERFGNAEHECGAACFLRSICAIRMAYGVRFALSAWLLAVRPFQIWCKGTAFFLSFFYFHPPWQNVLRQKRSFAVWVRKSTSRGHCVFCGVAFATFEFRCKITAFLDKLVVNFTTRYYGGCFLCKICRIVSSESPNRSPICR